MAKQRPRTLASTTFPRITKAAIFDQYLAISQKRGKIAISHTRTVVRECCKDDDQSLWEKPKFDPPPPLNPLTDRHQNLPTWQCRWCLSSWKISSRSDKGFRFLRMHDFAHQIVYSAIWSFFLEVRSSNRLQPRRPYGFWRKIHQKTRSRARMCLLGVAKPKVKLYALFCPTNRHFGARFRRDLEIFARKHL